MARRWLRPRSDRPPIPRWRVPAARHCGSARLRAPAPVRAVPAGGRAADRPGPQALPAAQLPRLLQPGRRLPSETAHAEELAGVGLAAGLQAGPQPEAAPGLGHQVPAPPHQAAGPVRLRVRWNLQLQGLAQHRLKPPAVAQGLQQGRAGQSRRQHHPGDNQLVAAAEKEPPARGPPPQSDDPLSQHLQPPPQAIGPEGAHGRQRIELAIAGGEQPGLGAYGHGRLQRLEDVAIPELQGHAKPLPGLRQALQSPVLVGIGGQHQQAGSEWDRLTGHRQFPAPLAPELERALPQAPAPAAVAPIHLAHEHAEGGPAAGSLGLGAMDPGVDHGDGVATTLQQPGGGKANDSAADHHDRLGVAGQLREPAQVILGGGLGQAMPSAWSTSP